MARKNKVGIDYFSHDVDMANDQKIKVLKAKHGMVGYAIYIRLLEEIYRDNGYYLERDEDFDILFANDNNIDFDVYKNAVNVCINKGLFNKNLHDDYNVLTSKRIQENYLEATKRRQRVDIAEEYLLVQPSDILGDYSKVNVNIYSINVDKSTQSKEKVKRKEIESKEKEELSVSPKAVNDFFEKTWKMYPVKKGKGQISKSTKRRAYDLGEEFIRCIERYIEDTKKSQTYRKHGSTFWNSGYVDYLDENYKDTMSSDTNSTDSQEERETKEALDKAFEQFEV